MSLALGKLDLRRPEALPPASSDPVVAGFLTVVDRLQTAVEFETDALSRHAAIDLGEVNRQKRQGMLELSRVMRSFADRPAPAVVRDRLATLAAALDRNRAVLDVHLGAVREVADIIARVLRDADWDGTYSMRATGP